MAISLLSTKLFIPLPRHNQVPRDRLVQRLKDGVDQGRPLILISAPAGFGKTTLVSAWLQAMAPDWSVAWVSLDDGDNDPVLFTRYLLASLQKTGAALGAKLEPLLTAAQLPVLAELAAMLINAIPQSENRLLLVLDDYHLVHAPEIHAFIQMLIEHQPRGMHLVLVTREDPPFPLPRLRARGQVTEVRERDLRFTQPEALAFYDQTMGLDLLPQWVAELEAHTEGWVAGLQLAGLAIQESPDQASIERFLQTFAGSDRYVIDYLLDEVYNRQPAEVQEFLLRSAVLERMCAPLCDQLLGLYAQAGHAAGPGQAPAVGRSDALLQRLEHSNLFLIPLDNTRTWYRYHHLFAELLRHRLVQERGSRFAGELHRAASAWYESQGFVMDAVRHALQTGDWDYSVGVVERYAMSIVSRSQVTTMLEWYKLLPDWLLRQRPLACIYMAWALVLLFREDYRPMVESWLQRAEQALQNEQLPETALIGPSRTPVNLQNFVRGQVAVVRSQNLLASFKDPVDPQELVALSQRGAELLPEIAGVERSVCLLNLALAHQVMSQAELAEPILADAYRLMIEVGNYFGATTAVWYQARLAFYQGRSARAEEICREGTAFFNSLFEHPTRDLPAFRSIYVAQAIITFEQNRLEETARLLDQSLDLTGWASWVEIWALALRARLYQVEGNDAGARQLLARMEKMGPQHTACARALQVLHSLMTAPGSQAVADQARIWAGEHGPDLQRYGVVTGLGPYHCDALYLKDTTWARVQIVLGERLAALAFIEPVLAAARQNGLVYRVVELSVLKAMAQDGGSRGVAPSIEAGEPGEPVGREAALHTLQAALALGERCGYLRVFDQGPGLDDLLAILAKAGSHREYIYQLAEAFGRSFLLEGRVSVPKTLPGGPSALLDPLSERELEVLYLIARGLSNAEICDQLVIALGTVKRHINNIYSKLDVQSRTQAVDKARQLGLL